MFDQQYRSIVSVEDPAIDVEKCDVEKYGLTRDESLLAWLPGQMPRRYVVRRLTRSEREFVYSRPTAKAASLFLQIALLRVEEPDGTTKKPTKQIPDISGRKAMQTVWDDTPGEELDALADSVDINVWHELANIVEIMAGMKLGEAYGSSTARFGLLPASQRALEQNARSRVAHT